MLKVFVLGGYGQFGRRLCRLLARRSSEVALAVGGRNGLALKKLQSCIPCEVHRVDVNRNLVEVLETVAPDLVVDCTGFAADHRIARSCISLGLNYIDISSAREFVCGISDLDEKAKTAGVAVISGTSTVPGLSSAVIDEIFRRGPIYRLAYGISPGNRTERGLETVRSVLEFVGKPLPNGRIGWQDLALHHFGDGVGWRWLGNVDAPDLAIFPERFGCQDIVFKAGLELSVLHLGLWFLSGLVRLGLIADLSRYARPLKKMSDWFLDFGSDCGGMSLHASGTGRDGEPANYAWQLSALGGDGPYVPVLGVAALVDRFIRKAPPANGAYPCVGVIQLHEFERAAAGLNIQFSPLCVARTSHPVFD